MKILRFNISRQSGSDRTLPAPPAQRSSPSALWLRGDDSDNTGSVLSNAYGFVQQ